MGKYIIVSHCCHAIFTKAPKCVIFIKPYHLIIIFITPLGAAIIFVHFRRFSIFMRNWIPIFVSRGYTIRPYISLFHQKNILTPYYRLENFPYLILQQIVLISIHSTSDRII